ncbi:MAG: 2-amino-4-hydroxy-6-hydroxymethyldihydropteridine diphosphokinase [Syntrophaceae bacterium]|nr:2-amino-4-hydroxy-6-hydroxymethyldihydropteridine diphosphokinase [Syntrophaceae bacterium]
MREVAYIGFGANLGDPPRKFLEAVDELKHLEGLRVVRLSSLYETEPIGLVDDGPNFVNAVIALVTDIAPEDLIEKLRSVEKKLGKSVDHKSDLSRLIDLDLLFYGSRIVNTEDLIIPHPRLTDRAFVLGPMAEIAPDLEHPVEKKSISALLGLLSPGQLQMIKVIKSN